MRALTLEKYYIYSSFPIRDLRVQEKFKKTLKSWCFKKLKLKAFKLHDLYTFLNFPVL